MDLVFPEVPLLGWFVVLTWPSSYVSVNPSPPQTITGILYLLLPLYRLLLVLSLFLLLPVFIILLSPSEQKAQTLYRAEMSTAHVMSEICPRTGNKPKELKAQSKDFF